MKEASTSKTFHQACLSHSQNIAVCFTYGILVQWVWAALRYIKKIIMIKNNYDQECNFPIWKIWPTWIMQRCKNIFSTIYLTYLVVLSAFGVPNCIKCKPVTGDPQILTHRENTHFWGPIDGERKLSCYKQLHQNMDIWMHNPNAYKNE